MLFKEAGLESTVEELTWQKGVCHNLETCYFIQLRVSMAMAMGIGTESEDGVGMTDT